MLKYKTDRTWYSRRLRHTARKWSGSIPITPEPARGVVRRDYLHTAQAEQNVSVYLFPALVLSINTMMHIFHYWMTGLGKHM